MPYATPNQWDYKPINLTDPQIGNPYLVIEWFFTEQQDFVNARKELVKWYTACFDEKCPLSAREVVLLMELKGDLIKLIEAASILKGQEIKCRPPSTDNLLDPVNYCRQSISKSSAWNYLPRFLSTTEYYKPGTVINSFFQYRNLPEWRDILEDYYAAAVSDCAISDSPSDYNILKGAELIGKLLEALHLIEVRRFDKEEV